MGGLGWERGSRKATAHGLCLSKRRLGESARGEPGQRRTPRTWSCQGFSTRRKVVDVIEERRYVKGREPKWNQALFFSQVGKALTSGTILPSLPILR